MSPWDLFGDEKKCPAQWQQAVLCLAGSFFPNTTRQELSVYLALEDSRFLILFYQFSSFFFFFFFSSHFMSPLLANLTPRRARTEHRRALIWSDFKTGAGANRTEDLWGAAFSCGLGLFWCSATFLSLPLSLSLPISSQIWPVLSPAEKMTMIDEVVILVFCSS